MKSAMEPALDAAFAALANATRRRLLDQLRGGEVSVSELAAPHAISLPAISRHLRVLEGAGLVTRSIDGKFHRVRLRPEAVQAAADWIEQHRRFWTRGLATLDAYFEASQRHD